MGDVIALQPLVWSLCEAGHEVVAYVRPAWFPALRPHRNLTCRAASPAWAQPGASGKIWRFVRDLRAFARSLAGDARGARGIDVRGDVRSVLALWLAGCASVETLDRYYVANDCRVVRGAAVRHRVNHGQLRWRLNFVFAPGLPSAPPTLAHLLPSGAVTEKGRVGLVPLTPWIGKQWFPERWRAVVSGLRSRGLSPVLLCGPGEAERCRAAAGMEASAQPCDVVECSSVVDWAAALARCERVVTVNTGPVHVACAVGRPVVLLEGSGRLPLWAPADPRSVVVEHQRDCPCAPCHQIGSCNRNCMAAITVDEVLAAV